MSARQPDDLAFWRGLVTGGCISGCVWITLGAVFWAIVKGIS